MQEIAHLRTAVVGEGGSRQGRIRAPDLAGREILIEITTHASR